MLQFIHFVIVIVTIAFVIYADEQGFMWMLGKKQTLSASRLHFLHQAVAFGLGALIISGGLLYVRAPIAYLSSTTFEIKMIAIAALIANTYAISRLSPLAATSTFAASTPGQKRALFISGGVSVMGWVVAGVCGLMLG